MAKKRKLNPNRFQPQADQSLFSLDPIRRDVIKWGLLAGAVGALFMLQPQFVWQFVGVVLVVFVANYHISKAARRIPRWHATILSFLGVMVAMVVVMVIGTVIMAYLGLNGA